MRLSGPPPRPVLCSAYINTHALDEAGGAWREWGRELLAPMLLPRLPEKRISLLLESGMGDGGPSREQGTAWPRNSPSTSHVTPKHGNAVSYGRYACLHCGPVPHTTWQALPGSGPHPLTTTNSRTTYGGRREGLEGGASAE